MKWSVTLTDRLGPEMLTVLEIKGQVLNRVRLHVKVPGLLLNLNALLTKKLPKFLSRLNEMSGGKEVYVRTHVKITRQWKSTLSRQIGWLPNLGQGSDLVRKMVTQRMNLQEFSNVIYVFDSIKYISHQTLPTSL